MTEPAAAPTLSDLAPDLRRILAAHDYTIDGITAALGPSATAALHRSDAAGVRRAASGAGDLGGLVRLFILRDRLPHADVEALLGADLVRRGLATGLLVSDAPDSLRADLDLRPLDLGSGPVWVFSDTDGSMVRTPTLDEHVLGVGQASESLLTITPRPRTLGLTEHSRVLDLGTGCGIQLLYLLTESEAAPRGTATDISRRCLDYAAATFAINGRDAELMRGPWYTSVEDREFDLVVANPPFVVGTPEIGHSYRESGLDLDGASETAVSGAASHLAPGGTAVMLASWVVGPEEDWRHRVSSWITSEGIDAWIIQRDQSDPELYVWTWLTDEGLDPRDPEFAEHSARWLDHFAENSVAGVGFGYVFLRAIDGPSSVLCEELTHPYESGLGDDALAYFERNAWLRERAAEHGGSEADALDAAVFALASDVHLHDSRHLDTDERTLVVERVTGARWRHEIDDLTRSLLLGMRSGALPLADLVMLAAHAHDLDADELLDSARPVVLDLLRHGIVVPAGPVASSSSTDREEA